VLNSFTDLSCIQYTINRDDYCVGEYECCSLLPAEYIEQDIETTFVIHKGDYATGAHNKITARSYDFTLNPKTLSFDEKRSGTIEFDFYFG
jgi:hypothetical protein